MDMELIKDILIGLATGIFSGIITGVIVSNYYRNKDAIRGRTKYFIKVRDCISNLVFECRQIYVIDTCYNNRSEMYDVLCKIKNIQIPVNYKWLKLNKKEQEYINEFELICSNIKDNVRKIMFYNDEIDGLTNNYNNGEDELTEEEYKRQLNELINSINSTKRVLDKECNKFKCNWPVLEEIMIKYNIK